MLTRVSDLRWLWTKLRRRLEYRRHDRRVRRRYSADAGATAHANPTAPAAALPWAADATPPGAVDALAAWRKALSANVTAGDAVLRHQVAVLSPEPFCIDLEPPANALDLPGAEEIDATIRAAWRRIDWHRDFRSGHRWDPHALYLDIRVAPVAGADIKTPRELSRFQHVPPLAAAGERGAVEFLLQVLDWIDANPPGRGVNWACTMDVALRAVGWIWGLRLFEDTLKSYPRAMAQVSASLELHAAHIEDNLEYYEECTSNHYLANVAGLVYIGAAFPGFVQADRWLLFGAQELVSEMKREVLADGGDHESSTHYHRLVAELFASSAALLERLPPTRRARLARVDRGAHRVRPRLRPPADSGLNLSTDGRLLPAEFHARLARMAEFTAALSKPNGLVPQFGDNDSARAHKLLGDADARDHRHLLALIEALTGSSSGGSPHAGADFEAALISGSPRRDLPRNAAGPIEPTPRYFPDSGIAVMQRGSAWLAFTCGPNGQGGRGGHGHNDKNSFELNVRGCDFIVDGGCPFYTSAPEVRNAFRATAAHNTVSVEGREQDEWAPGAAGLFRLPERSAPRLSIEGAAMVGRHRGYGAVHERRMELEDSRLQILDRLDSSATRWIHFNFDPAVRISRLTSGDGVDCELEHTSGLRLRIQIRNATDAREVAGHFGTGFGRRVPNRALRARLTQPECRTEISWDPR